LIGVPKALGPSKAKRETCISLLEIILQWYAFFMADFGECPMAGTRWKPLLRIWLFGVSRFGTWSIAALGRSPPDGPAHSTM
jgi:hypothetical protein